MVINYQQFLLNENIQQAKGILKKLNLNPEKEEDYKDIVKSLKNLPNLIGKFVDFRYNKDAHEDDIKRILNWITTNRDSVSKLPKNILNYSTLEELDDDIEDFKRKQKINRFYKSLYKSMREQVDKLDADKRKKFDELSLAYMNLSEAKQKQFTPLKYFERNNITITDFINALYNFMNKNVVNEDEKNVLEKIDKYGDNIKILYNMNDVLVIETENFEAVKELGSNSWCIVYGSDGTRNSYFGSETYNTQLIVFNFNLPSTSANSLFGITIYPDGKISGSGCQDRMNHYLKIEEIAEITNVPIDVFKPNEGKVELHKIKGSIDKIIEELIKDSSNNREIVNNMKVMSEKIREKIANYEIDKYNVDLDEVFLNIFKSFYKVNRNRTLNDHLFLKIMFDNKTPEEILNIVKDKDINLILNCRDYFDRYAYLIACLIFKNKISSQFFFLYYLNTLNKDKENIIASYNDIKIEICIKFINSLYDCIDLLTINQDDINKYSLLLKGSEFNKDAMIEIYDDMTIKIYQYLLENPKMVETFEKYKLIYDKLQSGEDEYPYEKFFDDLYIEASIYYMDEDIYVNFIIETLGKLRDDDFISSDDIVDKLDYMCEHSQENYTYDLLDKYDKKVYNIYETLNIEPDAKNDIILLMLYKNTHKYNNEFKKKMGVKISEDGTDYVVVPDFTSFDNMIFKEEYFNQIEDYRSNFDYEQYDDNSMESYFSDLDNYNLISIAESFMKEFPNLNIIDYEIVKKYLNEKGKINRILIGVYERDEEITKLYKELTNLIFDLDEEELEEIDEDLYNFIDDSIKRPFNNSLNESSESAYYDGLFKKLIEGVEDALGGSTWTLTEEEKSRGEKNQQIYKFVKNDKDNWDLLFTIDMMHILGDFKSYSDLYYYTGDTFKWDDIVSYFYKKNDPISVNFDYIYADIDKRTLNERVRDNI